MSTPAYSADGESILLDDGDVVIPVGRWPQEAEARGIGSWAGDVFTPATPAAATAPFQPLGAWAFRKGLLHLNLTEANVETMIDGIPDAMARENARIDWRYSPSYHRDNALLAGLAVTAGLTSAQVDAAWHYAEAL